MIQTQNPKDVLIQARAREFIARFDSYYKLLKQYNGLLSGPDVSINPVVNVKYKHDILSKFDVIVDTDYTAWDVAELRKIRTYLDAFRSYLSFSQSKTKSEYERKLVEAFIGPLGILLRTIINDMIIFCNDRDKVNIQNAA